PADWICASIEVCAPLPSATIVMTAATPTIMTSIVRAVPHLLRVRVWTAIRTIIRNDIDVSLCRPGRGFRARTVVGSLDAQRVPRQELVLREPLPPRPTTPHYL